MRMTTTFRMAAGALALALAGSLLASPPAPVQALPPSDPLAAACFGAGSDEFGGTSLDTAIWTVQQPTVDRHTVTGGALVMPTYLVNSADAPLITQPVPSGAWEATTKVSIATAGSFQQAGLNLRAGASDYAKLDVYNSGTTKRIQFTWTGRSSITGTDQIAAPAGTTDTVWFRLASDGTQITAAFSIDGQSFSAVGRPIALSSFSPASIGLEAIRGATSTAPEIDASFDWFRWSPDAAEVAACDGPTYAWCSGAGSDEFGAALDPARWTLSRPDADEHSVSGGALVLPTYRVNSADAPAVLQAAPGAVWEATTKVTIATTGSFQQAGLHARTSATDYAKLDIYNSSGNRRFQFTWTGRTTSSTVDQVAVPTAAGSTFWLRLTSDGTNLSASTSIDGVTFSALGRPIATSAFSPTQVGLEALRGATSTAPEIDASFDWFRWSPTPAERAACGYDDEPGGPDAFDTARLQYRELLTGGSDYDPAAAPFAASIDAIETLAQDAWDDLDTTPSPEPWPGVDTTDAEQLLAAVRRVKAMAVGWATHGSSLEGDPALLADAILALDWLNANRYNAATPAVSSTWWFWEIGIPLELNDITVLLYDELSPAQRDAYMDAIQHFSPSVTRTAANRVWASTVVGIRGIIAKDAAAAAAGRDGVVPALATVTTGDGIYADGSFVQHGYYAYTGGYGTSMLLSLSRLFAALDGSPWEPPASTTGPVYAWVAASFDPVMVDGAMMDSVRGREIARDYNQSHSAGAIALGAILVLAESADPATADGLRALALGHIARDGTETFWAPSLLLSDRRLSISEKALAERAIDDGVVAAAPTLGTVALNGMDRVVHHAEDFSLALALSSNRIANYESISNENWRSWLTGDGMTYLYTSDQSQFDGDFWPTVNRYRIPGVTADTMTRTASTAAGYRGTSAYAGGVASPSGLSGTAGMILDAAGSSLVARKSWFMFDDEIVVLGSGITATGQTGTGWDGQPRGVETVVENRKVDPASVLKVDGATVAASAGSTSTITDPTWAHLSNDGDQIGYVLPGAGDLSVLRENRTGTWSALNETGPTDSRSRQYVALWFEHGQNPTNATYSYALLPGASAAATSAYAASPDYRVLSNSSTVAAVEETTLDTVAAQFWSTSGATLSRDGAPFLTSSGRGAVVVEESDGVVSISVSAVGRDAGPLLIELHRSATALQVASPGVTITRLTPTVQLSIATTGSGGAPFEATFTTP